MNRIVSSAVIVVVSHYVIASITGYHTPVTYIVKVLKDRMANKYQPCKA